MIEELIQFVARRHFAMSKSDVNEQEMTNSEFSFTSNEQFNSSYLSENYLQFNILGKIYYVKQSLLEHHSAFDQFEQYYDQNRQEYIIDISPVIFENLLQYYKTQKLILPLNIQLNYFKETLEKFHIDTSSLDIDERFQRFVSRQTIFQLIHVLLEYPDCIYLKLISFQFSFVFLACRIAQILHYLCSIIALISCLFISLSLTSRDLNNDLHSWNTTETELPSRSKLIIAHFRYRPSNLFLIDIFCLIWAIVETILRTLSTPSLYNYFTTLGLFDITGKEYYNRYDLDYFK